MNPTILVIGAGSIGQRHARNLSSSARVLLTDPDRERREAVAGVEPVELDYLDLEQVEGVVVASPSALHSEQTRWLLEETSCRILVEKPLGTLADDLGPVVALGSERVMVGCNLRLHEPLERVVSIVKAGEIGTMVSARLWFGSWLPDWRPGVDYRKSYSASAAAGGGVLLDAIHELDLALWLSGADLEVVGAVVSRLGPLEIDVEDTVRALLTTPDDVPVEIALDYLSRRYRRGIEVVGDEATVRYDWARRVIELEDANSCQTEVIATSLDRSYEREAERFLDLVRDGTPPPVDAERGAAAVELARAITEAATT